MSKVYVVTAGQYSEYGIVAIFSTEELAQAYLTLEGEAAPGETIPWEIETWEMDDPDQERKFRRHWSVQIDLQTGALGKINSYVDMEKVTKRGSVHYIQSYDGKGPWGRGRSFVSPEHAQKLAVEARQLWLRAGSPLTFHQAWAFDKAQEVEI